MGPTSLGELADNELIPLCVGNDAEAWEELVKRHRRRVFNIAYQFVGRFDEAEDLTQDLFFKIHGSLKRYDTSRNFVFWLSKITKNLCIDHYRQRRRERELFTESEEVFKVLESSRLDPYGSVRRQEKVDFLRRGLASLSAHLREAVVLRDIQELTYQEIATRLGIAECTVKSRINRGRTELSAILNARERDEKVVRDDSPGQGRSRSRGRKPTGV